MNQEKNPKNIPLFIVKMLGIFLIVMLILEFGGGVLSVYIRDSLSFGKYASNFITEIMVILILLIVLFLSKNKYVFTQRHDGFFKSLKYGIPILIATIFFLFNSIININLNDTSLNIYNFISLILYCASVGVFEELLCRGWFQNELIERLGTDKKGIILSIICSSFVFGLIHLPNIGIQTPFETVIQILYAFGVGLFFGAIYYKTKNIWSVIFLHGFYDFSVMLESVNAIQDCTLIGNNISKLTMIANIIPNLCMAICYIIVAIFIMKIALKQMNFVDNTSKDVNKKNHKILIFVSIIILIFGIVITMIIPEDAIKKDYTCYSYEEKMLYHVEKRVLYYNHYEINDISNNGEQINFEFTVVNSYNKNSYLLINNLNTNQKQKIKIENIKEFVVYENDNHYDILIYASNLGTNNKIYYNNFISKNNLTNDNNYLLNIDSEFKEYDVPELNHIGYVISHSYEEENDTTIYPYYQSTLYDDFIIDKNYKVFLSYFVDAAEILSDE